MAPVDFRPAEYTAGMYRLPLAAACLFLASCAGTGSVVPQTGSLQGLVDAQRALDARIPGGYRAVVESVGIARSGDVGYTAGHWSLRVDDLPQFSDARGSFVTIWTFEGGGWRALSGGRAADLSVELGAPQWSGVNNAAATTPSSEGAPPVDADATVHPHGMQVSLAGDIAVQWGVQHVDASTRRNWVRVWHHTEFGWELQIEWVSDPH